MQKKLTYVFRPYLWSKLSMSDRNETSLKRLKESIKKNNLGGVNSRGNM